ncbi:sodium:alanine symporter [Betaproteobacteria bacterium]|nr:sodium:alanine symporter [Betaproteobacteria bacterium]GHT99825.1 sodium:alanine symporter [Betaproteobacteria bacterium]GHU14940.1 sodium:alanine symporter [Betaproteobacteria bacterium]GHU19373.1 sodium:alanine symporter [Betaproteobacteria bacterium]GHU30797.1 sodium:alanine symporter [Betaproteobacteria bacterium]
MQPLSNFIDLLDGIVWGPYVLIPLLLTVGVFLTIGLRFQPWRRLPHAFAVMWKGRHHHPDHEGELSPFRALMTSLAATIGTGNIVGVATAILMGGPGAVFWMWMTALFGMATKFCEATLAVKYREVTPDGKFVGGPMYYIKNGLGPDWKWLATLFAIFGTVASFGIGNMAQANAITLNVVNLGSNYGLQLDKEVVAAALFILAALVLVGGVKRIGAVAGTLVPVMALVYVAGSLIVLGIHIDKVPAAFALIFESAFTGHAAVGGFTGATLAMAIRFGVARGLFSNEAGMGSAPIAHATAIVKNPVKQGLLGMLDPFLDTIIVCSMTALVIIVSGQWIAPGIDKDAGILTSAAFNSVMPGGFGMWLVTIGIVLFAFSTILGWCVYGERCVIYLFGHKAALPFRIFFTLIVPVGALAELKLVWNLSDLFNGLMAIPNLIALLLLSPVVFKLAREFFLDPHNET